VPNEGWRLEDLTIRVVPPSQWASLWQRSEQELEQNSKAQHARLVGRNLYWARRALEEEAAAAAR
jgi:hypothetical protein